MSDLAITIQAVSVATALLASGSIATFSLFDVPEFKSQPASRSLPQIRWLFSRGSHIFPPAALVSTAGFAYLAYDALPRSRHSFVQLVRLAANSGRVNGFLAAAALCISIYPITRFAMVPTNFRLMELNKQKGGLRSEASTRQAGAARPGDRSAGDSVRGEGEAAEFTDLSGPQGRAGRDASEAEEVEVEQLLTVFGWLNLGRALAIGAGGIVGLVVALAG